MSNQTLIYRWSTYVNGLYSSNIDRDIVQADAIIFLLRSVSKLM